jgi:hypothetical protein
MCSGADDGHVSLALFAAMFEWVEQLRVEARQAGEILGIYFIGLALVGVDEPQFPSVGHQHLVAALLQEPANPRRVSSRFYCYAHGTLGGEASS